MLPLRQIEVLRAIKFTGTVGGAARAMAEEILKYLRYRSRIHAGGGPLAENSRARQRRADGVPDLYCASQ
jgi:alkylation response protein AidB-like acyl-CoA dehydrogenase